MKNALYASRFARGHADVDVESFRLMLSQSQCVLQRDGGPQRSARPCVRSATNAQTVRAAEQAGQSGVRVRTPARSFSIQTSRDMAPLADSGGRH